MSKRVSTPSINPKPSSVPHAMLKDVTSVKSNGPRPENTKNDAPVIELSSSPVQSDIDSVPAESNSTRHDPAPATDSRRAPKARKAMRVPDSGSEDEQNANANQSTFGHAAPGEAEEASQAPKAPRPATRASIPAQQEPEKRPGQTATATENSGKNTNSKQTGNNSNSKKTEESTTHKKQADNDSDEPSSADESDGDVSDAAEDAGMNMTEAECKLKDPLVVNTILDGLEGAELAQMTAYLQSSGKPQDLICPKGKLSKIVCLFSHQEVILAKTEQTTAENESLKMKILQLQIALEKEIWERDLVKALVAGSSGEFDELSSGDESGGDVSDAAEGMDLMRGLEKVSAEALADELMNVHHLTDNLGLALSKARGMKELAAMSRHAIKDGILHDPDAGTDFDDLYDRTLTAAQDRRVEERLCRVLYENQ
ncbi:hypothetical protein RSAG8_09910, partial [Rhizoctonia solani AG-8 WAC10335]